MHANAHRQQPTKHKYKVRAICLTGFYKSSLLQNTIQTSILTRMRLTSSIFTLLFATALAIPHIQRDTDTPDAADGEMSIMAQKNWQAKGGCKRDWDDDNGYRCKTACAGEAVRGECPQYKEVSWAIQGGCVVSWHTCRCFCYY